MGSDHSPTIVTLYEYQYQTEDMGRPVFKLRKADWSRYKRFCNESLTIGTVTESSTNDAIDVDDMYNKIVQAIISAAEKSIPRTRNSSHHAKKVKKLPYWNDDCRNAIYARNRARNRPRMNRNCTAENVESYRRLKGIAQRTIKIQLVSTGRHFAALCIALQNYPLFGIWLNG